jgi:hypothetical protein
MRGVPLLSGSLLVRFQDCIDEGPCWFQLWSLAYRCLALYRNGAEHRLPHQPPMNPKLLGNPSNRSTTMFVLASDLLE